MFGVHVCINYGRSEDMRHMSELVFRGLCLKVGTSEQITIRRETTGIEEALIEEVKPINELMDITMILSGSLKEGFRLEGSDVDVMIWRNDARVITDMTQSTFYDQRKTLVLLSDSSESPPGFTLLRLVKHPIDIDVNLPPIFVKMNEGLYISSYGFKGFLSWFAQGFFPIIAHGPCASTFKEGIDMDMAFCFACDFWPYPASSWKDRCLSWPNPEVVNDIIRSGCHYVPIGHPLGQHGDLEWRVSFSQAEHKCVYAMNHCQFLIYGLLKIFLKEVINQQQENTNKLLCSYHIKTTVLWAIQQETIPDLCPNNLLVGFWTCFKLLLKWVNEGICPNFFIPENNLFLSKIYGSAQIKLFLHLHELYERGLSCLLQCASVRSWINDVLYKPRLSISTYESVMSWENDFDEKLFNASLISYMCPTVENEFVETLNALEQLIGSSPTQIQVLYLQMFTVPCLQNISFNILHKFYNAPLVNKQFYTAIKLCGQMLKLAAKFGLVSDMLYIAMFYYKTFQYKKALSVLEKTKARLAHPDLMYIRHVNREIYFETVGRKSWATKRKQAVASDITLKCTITYIDELKCVQQFVQQNGDPDCELEELEIPVFVMLHFLEFLCYRHIDTTLSQAAPEKLQFLYRCGKEPYICDRNRDIYLQILEICHQTAGLH